MLCDGPTDLGQAVSVALFPTGNLVCVALLLVVAGGRRQVANEGVWLLESYLWSNYHLHRCQRKVLLVSDWVAS